MIFIAIRSPLPLHTGPISHVVVRATSMEGEPSDGLVDGRKVPIPNEFPDVIELLNLRGMAGLHCKGRPVRAVGWAMDGGGRRGTREGGVNRVLRRGLLLGDGAGVAARGRARDLPLVPEGAKAAAQDGGGSGQGNAAACKRAG